MTGPAALSPSDVAALDQRLAQWGGVLTDTLLNQLAIIDTEGESVALVARTAWACEAVRDHPQLAAEMLAAAIHSSALAYRNTRDTGGCLPGLGPADDEGAG